MNRVLRILVKILQGEELNAGELEELEAFRQVSFTGPDLSGPPVKREPLNAFDEGFFDIGDC